MPPLWFAMAAGLGRPRVFLRQVGSCPAVAGPFSTINAWLQPGPTAAQTTPIQPPTDTLPGCWDGRGPSNGPFPRKPFLGMARAGTQTQPWRPPVAQGPPPSPGRVKTTRFLGSSRLVPNPNPGVETPIFSPACPGGGGAGDLPAGLPEALPVLPQPGHAAPGQGRHAVPHRRRRRRPRAAVPRVAAARPGRCAGGGGTPAVARPRSRSVVCVGIRHCCHPSMPTTCSCNSKAFTGTIGLAVTFPLAGTITVRRQGW